MSLRHPLRIHRTGSSDIALFLSGNAGLQNSPPDCAPAGHLQSMKSGMPEETVVIPILLFILHLTEWETEAQRRKSPSLSKATQMS